jgi:alkanesulfonate monooxygenase SsuD/methylene tetrahydromethanopterin reductase-like flavin-dependent oxidoreductase (luciferase family)
MSWEVPVEYNEQELERIAIEEKREYERLLDNLTTVMRTEDGQNVIWHILSECGIYVGGASGEEAFRQQGRRDIGLMLIGLMHDAAPTMYAELQLRKAKDGRDND